eukprot:scaffold139652_cov22-Tisochrysis_lutea.AAC.2
MPEGEDGRPGRVEERWQAGEVGCRARELEGRRRREKLMRVRWGERVRDWGAAQRSRGALGETCVSNRHPTRDAAHRAVVASPRVSYKSAKQAPTKHRRFVAVLPQRVKHRLRDPPFIMAPLHQESLRRSSHLQSAPEQPERSAIQPNLVRRRV